jgi:hypothetical protein
MLRIPDQFLACSVYLYRSEEEASNGAHSGGSGFIVGVPLEVNAEETQLYAVTNQHVIRKYENPVIRLNTVKGNVECMVTNKLRWDVDTENDLAVLPLLLNENEFQLAYVPDHQLMTEPFLEAMNIGPGDEVFIIGRFVGHDGQQRNTPSVRFGNISMMPREPRIDPQANQAFLVDCRSMPGYSGSPVFVMFDPARALPPHWDPPKPYQPGWHGPWLLGVDSFHVSTYEPLLSDKVTDKEVVPNLWVKANAGMAGVVPAWHLHRLLSSPKLVAHRQKRDNEITTEKQKALI